MIERDTNGRIRLPRYSRCFVCGDENPIGLDLTFYYNHGRIETQFMPESKHAGYHDIIHGGLLAALLDECMGWSAIISRAVMCYTVDLAVRYKSGAHAGEPLFAFSELIKDRKRMILAKGQIEKSDGTLVCTGEGKYVPLPPEEQENVIDYAGWGEELNRVHEKISALNLDHS